ncbi:MAG: hypothetical protein RLZZ142_2761 [Verrucomicrobiota bacterium]|jgi:hypothetical protein
MESADRFEFKFLLDPSQYERLLSTFGAHLQPDTLGGPSGAYPVVSLYYDTPDFDAYWDAWRRVPSRRKLRVRVYGSRDGAIPPATFLEVKCKVDGRGIKHRLQTDLPSALALASGHPPRHQPPVHARTVLEQVQQLVHEERVLPCCVIRYQRRAFSLSHLPEEPEPLAEPLRITLDESLQVRFDDLLPEPDDSRFTQCLLPPERRILEIKGAGAVPYTLSTFLGRNHLHPTSFSKYCHAMRPRLSA